MKSKPNFLWIVLCISLGFFVYNSANAYTISTVGGLTISDYTFDNSCGGYDGTYSFIQILDDSMIGHSSDPVDWISSISSPHTYHINLSPGYYTMLQSGYSETYPEIQSVCDNFGSFTITENISTSTQISNLANNVISAGITDFFNVFSSPLFWYSLVSIIVFFSIIAFFISMVYFL